MKRSSTGKQLLAGAVLAVLLAPATPQLAFAYPIECNPSPILLDTRNDGYALTDAATGVDFDFNGDGARGRVSWTRDNTDEAFLVLDRDGNGTIDRGAELFGNYTPQPASKAPNGFLALAEFDKPANGGNGDGLVNALDSIFAQLRLWKDSNHNGFSEPDELFTLSQLGVTAFSLDYYPSNKVDANGNAFRYFARVYGQGINRIAWDVFFVPGLPGSTTDGGPQPICF